jgi:hypothetical protein
MGSPSFAENGARNRRSLTTVCQSMSRSASVRVWRWAFVLALAALATACLADQPLPRPPSQPVVPSASPATSDEPSAPPSAGPGPTAEPTAAPSPLPSAPARLERVATAEENGIRITIELERNPMPAGEPTSVTATIKNTGHDPVIYYPCGEAVTVSAEISDQPWRPGANLVNQAMAWKGYLTGGQGLRDSGRTVVFFSAGQDGAASGCGDVGHAATIAPGATFRERDRWDGFTFRRLAPPPTASIDLVGSFSFDRGDPRVEHPLEGRRLIEVHLATWIAGLAEAFLDPGEAVDIALTDPRLTAILASRDVRTANVGVLIFDPAARAYQIGMLESGALPVSRAHLLIVDARSGAIVGWVERAWDYAVDGYP